MSLPIPIALIDDHTLFRDSLRRVLESEHRIHIVAEATGVAEAVSLCTGAIEFRLALIDYQLHPSHTGGGGLEVLRALHEHHPQTKAIMLTAGLPPRVLAEVVREHRTGVFLKTEPVADLLIAIEKTLGGEVWTSSLAAAALPQREGDADPAATLFTPRESMVLRLITEGRSNKEIGGALNTTETNVKAILQRLFQKTGVRSRSQLVRYVFECDLELP